MSVKIIAEISANHRGNKQEALALIEMAKQCGADYVKFQCFDPLTMSMDPWPYFKNMTPWQWFPDLFGHAKAIGIPAFSSVFCEKSLEYILQFKPPFIKIASFENTHWPLIVKAAETGIPLIISTGMMTLDEHFELWNRLVVDNSILVDFLKCTSAYPAPDESLNLGAIRTDRLQGFSDHTIGWDAAMMAVAAGAKMIERHIALSDDAVDAACSSVGILDFEMYVKAVRRAEAMCGTHFGPMPQELTSARRCLYSTQDIKPNDKFTVDNVAVLRGPGGGIHPRYYGDILRLVSRREIKAGEPILERDL